MRSFLAILVFTTLNSCNGKASDTAVTDTNKTTIANTLKTDRPIAEDNGIIFFSFDNGTNWENKSNGLPDNIFLTDIAASDEFLGVTTKQNGIFLYDFKKNSWVSIATNPQTTYNLDALFFYNGKIFVGTQNGGIFISDNQGKTWTSHNEGLGNLTIRKFEIIDTKLHVGTSGGLYSLNDQENKWVLEYGQNTLQVNGITDFDGEIYIGTNQGVFKSLKQQKEWKHIMSNRSLHNISSDDKTVYAMVYNELFASTDKGNTWQSMQKGLPAELYSFQLMKKENTLLVGQWDGVYKKESSEDLMYSKNEWIFSSNGLPSKFAVTEMKIYRNIIVIGCSESKLRKGMTINK